jgi:hypothetical protein
MKVFISVFSIVVTSFPQNPFEMFNSLVFGTTQNLNQWVREVYLPSNGCFNKSAVPESIEFTKNSYEYNCTRLTGKCENDMSSLCIDKPGLPKNAKAYVMFVQYKSLDCTGIPFTIRLYLKKRNGKCVEDIGGGLCNFTFKIKGQIGEAFGDDGAKSFRYSFKKGLCNKKGVTVSWDGSL